MTQSPGFEEVVRRFGEASDSDLRTRVSWSLFNECLMLDSANRNEEAQAVYGQLIARRDEALDPELEERVAWAMQKRAAHFDDEGQSEEEFLLLDDLVARFGESTEPEVRKRVADALTTKASTLYRLGRYDEELAAYDDLIDRFASEPALRERIADSQRRRAITLEMLDRPQEAIAGYDEALRQLADLSEPSAGQQLARVLLSKGLTLDSLKRAEEAVVVFDGVVSTYRELSRDLDVEAAADMLARAVLALLYKAYALCTIGRTQESAVVRDQLTALLEDVTEPRGASPERRAADESEAELATLLARTHSGECWMRFATSGDDDQSREAAAWAWQHLDQAAPATAATLFIAQAFFVANHTQASSSAEIFPHREQLHDLLHESDAYEWLTNEDVDLPDWLEEEPD